MTTICCANSHFAIKIDVWRRKQNIASATNAGIPGSGPTNRSSAARPGFAFVPNGPEGDKAYLGIGRGPEEQPTAAWNIGSPRGELMWATEREDETPKVPARIAHY
jgi:hypothetical protein